MKPRHLLLTVAIICTVSTGSVQAVNRTIDVAWDPPTNLAGPGGSCETQGAALTQEDIASLQYQVRWRTDSGAEWTYATTAATHYSIAGVPSGSTLTVEVGAFLPGGQVGCWASGSIVVPVPHVGPCGGLRLSAQ